MGRTNSTGGITMNIVLYARTVDEHESHVQYDDCCFGGVGTLPGFPNKLLNAGINFFRENKKNNIHLLEPYNCKENPDQELVDCGADVVVFPVVESFERQMMRTFDFAKAAGIKPVCVTPSVAYGQYLEKKYPGLEYKQITFPTDFAIPEDFLTNPYGFAFHKYVPNYQIGVGCVNSCAFCIWSNVKSQMKNPSIAINDLKLLQRYSISLSPYLLCSSLIQNEIWFNHFAREKLFNLPDLKYITDINPMDITEENVRMLKISGCKLVIVGIESANNIVRQEINKPGTIEQVQEKLDILKTEDIKVQSSFLYNLSPNEDALIDVKFAQKNPTIQFNTGVVKCYRGTPIEYASIHELNFNGNKIMTTAYLDKAIENMIKLNKEIPSIDVEQVTRW